MKELIEIELDVIYGALCLCFSGGGDENEYERKSQCDKLCCKDLNDQGYQWVTPRGLMKGNKFKDYQCK